MPELELVEERLISGVGVLRVPLGTLDGRYYRLCIDVIREVPQPFESFKYTPTRSRYCTLSFMRDGYVIQEETVDYKKRCFDFVSDIAGQTLIAVKCMYKGLLQTFVNLGNALILFPFVVDNKIEEYEHLNLFWDEVLVTCESTTAVQVRLFILNHADDCESSDPFRPPPPPNPLPEVPPGTGIGTISPPYDLDPFTSPNPLDEGVEPEEPLFGEECQGYQIFYQYLSTDGVTRQNSGFVRGRYGTNITFVGTGGSSFEFRIKAQAGSSTLNGLASRPCLEVREVVFDTIAASGTPVSVTFLSATPL